jgi:hypothetical protein
MEKRLLGVVGFVGTLASVGWFVIPLIWGYSAFIRLAIKLVDILPIVGQVALTAWVLCIMVLLNQTVGPRAQATDAGAAVGRFQCDSEPRFQGDLGRLPHGLHREHYRGHRVERPFYQGSR